MTPERNPAIAPKDGFRQGVLWRLDVVSSTMDVARDAPSCGGVPLTIVARAQTSGRGRYDRSWTSPAEGGLYLTARVPWNRPIAQAPVVSMGAALALARLARSLGCPDVVLKWPNDLLLNGAKAAGLLAEMGDTPDGSAVLVGVGLNVATPESTLRQVGQPATSLSLACGRGLDEDEVLSCFLALWTEIDITLERDGFAAVADEYREFSDLEGRAFRLATAGTEELVRFVRVNDDGSLALRRASGELFTTFGGELLKA